MKSICKNCGGDGYTLSDTYDHRGEHQQIRIPCGCSYRDPEDYDEIDDQDF
jgi:rRNA maturation protein Nop10